MGAIQIDEGQVVEQILSVSAESAAGLEVRLQQTLDNVTPGQGWGVAQFEVAGSGAGGRWLALVTLEQDAEIPPWFAVPGVEVVAVEAEGSVDSAIRATPLTIPAQLNLGALIQDAIEGTLGAGDSWIGEVKEAGTSDGHRFLALAIGTIFEEDPPPLDFGDELARAIHLGGVSADPLGPVELAVPGTYWLGEPGTPPEVPAVQSDGSVWIAPVDCELYAFAIVQTAGIAGGTPNNTWSGFVNEVAIGDTVVGVDSSLGGFITRQPIDPPVNVNAGDRVNGNVIVPAGNTLRNPTLILFPRPR